MAHFAQLDENNTVINVIVVHNNEVNNLPFPESEPLGVAFCQSLFGVDTIWKQTSYNVNFRKNYAGLGYTYDAQRDAFIPPRPQPECMLDPETFQWLCPPPVEWFKNLMDEETLQRLSNPTPAIIDPAEMP